VVGQSAKVCECRWQGNSVPASFLLPNCLSVQSWPLPPESWGGSGWRNFLCAVGCRWCVCVWCRWHSHALTLLSTHGMVA